MRVVYAPWESVSICLVYFYIPHVASLPHAEPRTGGTASRSGSCVVRGQHQVRAAISLRQALNPRSPGAQGKNAVDSKIVAPAGVVGSGKEYQSIKTILNEYETEQ